MSTSRGSGQSTLLHQKPMEVIRSFISEKSPYQIDRKELYAYSYKDFLDFIKLTSFDKLISFIHGDCSPEILENIDNLLRSFFEKSIKMETKKNTPPHWFPNRKNIKVEKADIDPSFVIFNFILNETNSRRLALLYLSRAYLEEKIFFFLREKRKEPIYYYEIATVDDGLQFLSKSSKLS